MISSVHKIVIQVHAEVGREPGQASQMTKLVSPVKTVSFVLISSYHSTIS